MRACVCLCAFVYLLLGGEDVCMYVWVRVPAAVRVRVYLLLDGEGVRMYVCDSVRAPAAVRVRVYLMLDREGVLDPGGLLQRLLILQLLLPLLHFLLLLTLH